MEKLPEGTVAEAYISFDRLFTTDELLQQFEHRNMTPVWFAADTGPDSKQPDNVVVHDPLGFPAYPIWHYDDLKTKTESEKKWGFFGKVVTKSSTSPSVNTYGDGELRNDNFLKTLHLLQQYKTITKQVAPFLKIDQAVQYLEQNGVKLYGVVVTGPTKELLKLREEKWVKELHVGEVRLWNWHDRTE